MTIQHRKVKNLAKLKKLWEVEKRCYKGYLNSLKK